MKELKHIHHIIPRHMGGTDDPENLIELTLAEHAMAHLKLYEEHGKRQDLWAYKFLSGRTEEAWLLNCSAGGKIQGQKNAENGHMQKIQKMADWSEAGKKGGAATMASGKGAFGDPIERLKSCVKGGKAQGKRNADSGHLAKIAQMPIELNKRNLGQIWITNGEVNKMIKPTDEIPDGYKRGKTQRK